MKSPRWLVWLIRILFWGAIIGGLVLLVRWFMRSRLKPWFPKDEPYGVVNVPVGPEFNVDLVAPKDERLITEHFAWSEFALSKPHPEPGTAQYGHVVRTALRLEMLRIGLPKQLNVLAYRPDLEEADVVPWDTGVVPNALSAGDLLEIAERKHDRASGIPESWQDTALHVTARSKVDGETLAGETNFGKSYAKGPYWTVAPPRVA